MTRFTIVLPDEVNERFRKAVFKRKGMKRGNVTKALIEALDLWSRSTS